MLKKTGAVMAPGGTIAISEFLVNEERSGPPIGLIFGINMLVATERCIGDGAVRRCRGGMRQEGRPTTFQFSAGRP